MNKILIVDDSAFMRGQLKDILIEGEYKAEEIIEAKDGADAMEKFKTERPNLMLLDVIMPEVDGIGVLRKIAMNVHTIVVSAVGNKEMIDEAKEHGALDYIVKPFEKKEVLEKVNKYINL